VAVGGTQEIFFSLFAPRCMEIIRLGYTSASYLAGLSSAGRKQRQPSRNGCIVQLRLWHTLLIHCCIAAHELMVEIQKLFLFFFSPDFAFRAPGIYEFVYVCLRFENV
jgi:hypothetical protein